MKICIYDTTLREGAQGAGVKFSQYEKELIATELDRLGADYVEVGFFGDGSPADILDMPRRCKTEGASLSLLCPTRRAGASACAEEYLRLAAQSEFKTIAVVGKASLWQVTSVIGTDADENLAMIKDTVSFLVGRGKEVFFDAEHFFDGYSDDPEYAKSALAAAIDAGAAGVVLCDTNGGMLPDVIGLAVKAVHDEFPHTAIGIHCHNDIGMADASSVAAVLSGASQVQCTVSGIGERCGNANLSTVVPVLQLKLGFDCISGERLAALSATSRRICQIANLGFDESDPFVGSHAFMHKAGMHIDGVSKQPSNFEHIDPALVGNRRSVAISELAGKSALREIMTRFGINVERDDPVLPSVLAALRDAEERGYQFENSEASLLLLILHTVGSASAPFSLADCKLLLGGTATGDAPGEWSAIVKIAVGGENEMRAAEGDGPVNALDNAAHEALERFYPYVNKIKMTDIKARIDSNDSAASASIVRVFVESSDGERVWRTTGASTDIIAAGRQALMDSYEYYILLNEGRLPQKTDR